MKCKHCKKKIPEDAFFCPYCGLVVDDTAEYDEEESPKVLWKPREEKPQDNAKEKDSEKNTLKDKAEWYARSPEKPKKKSVSSNRYLGLIGMIILIMIFLMIAIWLVFSTLDVNERRAREERQEALKAEEQKNRQQREENLEKNKGSTKSDDEEDNEDENYEEITFSIIEEPEDFGEYFKLSVMEASASSVILQDGTDNSAIKAADGSAGSSWQEGVAGDGIGESLHFQLARSYKVKYMSFQLGNWNSDEYYIGNNRPKELEITVGGVTQSVIFPDGKTEYWIELSRECTASEIDLVIQSVYSGSKWDDTCIAEIGIYGRGNLQE